jgi:hypothetical protein
MTQMESGFSRIFSRRDVNCNADDADGKRIFADFSRRDVNCNADDADRRRIFADFPVVMSIATRMTRIFPVVVCIKLILINEMEISAGIISAPKI